MSFLQLITFGPQDLHLTGHISAREGYEQDYLNNNSQISPLNGSEDNDDNNTMNLAITLRNGYDSADDDDSVNYVESREYDHEMIDFNNLESKTIENKEIKECSICCDKQTDIITECHHKFCKICIEKWCNLKNKKYCPCCRNDLSQNKIFSILLK